MKRFLTYSAVRLATLALMVVVGVYLAVVFINYGGYIDEMYRGEIYEIVEVSSRSWGALSPAEASLRFDETVRSLEIAYGLDQPFLLRCLRWTWDGLTFNWGSTLRFQSLYRESASIRVIILERIPNTLLLAGTANLLIFVLAILAALNLSHRYNSLTDRIFIALSPISSIPNWAYGILLVSVFAGMLGWLPFSGMFDSLPPETIWGYIPIVFKHMILPLGAILLSSFFQLVYTWRSFFLVQSGEHYVELAQAKGLSNATLERRYLLRPALPAVLTSFTMLAMNFWQGSMLLEKIFNWPGIGGLFLDSVRSPNGRSITISVLVIYALFLAVTMFTLDIVYALVDPRLKVESKAAPRIARPRQNWLETWGDWRQAFWPIRIPVLPKFQFNLPDLHKEFLSAWRQINDFWSELRRFPSALAGLFIILAFSGVSLYTVSQIPYAEAVARWRTQRNDSYLFARNAKPIWVNFFNGNALPPTIYLNSRDNPASRQVVRGDGESSTVTIDFTFDFPYNILPQDLLIRYDADYAEKRPFASLEWLTPDGRSLDMGNMVITGIDDYIFSISIPKKLSSPRPSQKNVYRLAPGDPPAAVLFADPNVDTIQIIPGQYTLRIHGIIFEPEADLHAEMVLYGEVQGLAGTDYWRRDLLLALLWGAPSALAIGLAGSFITATLSLTLAAFSAWWGGFWDWLIQFLSEVNMIIPALPFAIMVYYVYSKSLWAVLAAYIAFNIFGTTIKNYRAAFLQFKEAPYIEAAEAYGASSWRIILHYLAPRLLPALVPQLAILTPVYVFFEAGLAYLSISDPYLPTWGKVIYDALTIGAMQGASYWVLQPLVLLMLIALGFSLVGFALERIFNPQLREGG